MTLRLPGSARGDIEFDTFSGQFNSDLPVALSTSSRRNFRGTLNGGGSAEFRLKTFSGDVTIPVIVPSKVQVSKFKVKRSAGRVRPTMNASHVNSPRNL